MREKTGRPALRSYYTDLEQGQIHFTRIDYDKMEDGTTFQRTRSAALDATGLVLLDQVIAGTYGLTLAADISAGHIKLSSVEQSAGYRTTSDGEKTTWNGKPDDMDEIGEGVTYQKVRATDIAAGHIKLTSAVVVDGEWYDESGVEIDASHGINIYGTNQAFTTRATKTGTIQCYVGADGLIYAGAGAVKLSAAGITIIGGKLTLKSPNEIQSGEIEVDNNGYLLLGAFGLTRTGTVYPRVPAYQLGSSSCPYYAVWAHRGHFDTELYIPTEA